MESKKKMQNRWIFCIELQCVQIYMTLIGNKYCPAILVFAGLLSVRKMNYFSSVK